MGELLHQTNRLGDLVGKSPAMQAVFSRLLKAAACDMPVILFGPAGSGKRLAARTLHDLSLRRSGPFVPVVTSGDPERLRQRLFGEPGLVAAALGGTLYIDEVANLDHAHQVTLLRALEPPASAGPDLRLVTATCREPEALLASGRIREDFHYRTHVIPVRMPTLADRRGDLPLLAEALSRRLGLRPLTAGEMERLSRRAFPGNVRELAEALRAMATLQPGAPAPPDVDVALSGRSLKKAVADFERAVIRRALEEARGDLARTADRLGMNPNALRSKIKAFGLRIDATDRPDQP